MPRRRSRPSTRVLVRHVSGLEKYVQRSRLSQLSANWKRVSEKKKPAQSGQPSASTTATDPDSPDSEKE